MMNTDKFPDVRGRWPIRERNFKYGDVVAFRYKDFDKTRTGIMVMEGGRMFIAAWNLYEEKGRIWISDEIPDNIEFFQAWNEEVVAGHKYLLQGFAHFSPIPERDYIMQFIDKHYEEHLCYEVLMELTYMDLIPDPQESIKTYWKLISTELEQANLQFDKKRFEMYFLLLSVLRVQAASTKRNVTHYMDLLDKGWHHFSWMYGAVVGRLIGTDDKTFTAMVNHLDNTGRSPYVHLYLPLIEDNIDKILNYSAIEKEEKLRKSIDKIKLTEQRVKQETDLDELYGILFPAHFRKHMKEVRPAATISEMKTEMAQTREQLEHWKREAKNLEQQVEELTNSMESQVIKSFSLDDVASAILDMNVELGKMVFYQLDFKLRRNNVWATGRNDLLDRMEQKEKEENERRGISMGDNCGVVVGGNANFTLTDDLLLRLVQERGLLSNTSPKQIDNK